VYDDGRLFVCVYVCPKKASLVWMFVITRASSQFSLCILLVRVLVCRCVCVCVSFLFFLRFQSLEIAPVLKW
jgi:hypothetical protein